MIILLQRQDWLNLVEKVLSPHLCTYIVDNKADKKTFDSLMEELMAPKTIIDKYAPRMEIQAVVEPFSVQVS